LREGEDMPLDKNDEIADLKVYVRQNQEDLEILRLDMNRQEYLHDNVEKQNKALKSKLEKIAKHLEAQESELKSELKTQVSELKLEIKTLQSELKSDLKKLSEIVKCIYRNENYYDQYTESCYKYEVLTDKNRTWNDAQNECVNKSGTLASVHSEEEWIFIKGILTKADVSGGLSGVWLGGSEKRIEGNWQWVWTDGTPVNYSDWGGGCPMGINVYHCIYAYANADNWQWCNLRYTTLFYAVCKIPA